MAEWRAVRAVGRGMAVESLEGFEGVYFIDCWEAEEEEEGSTVVGMGLLA